MNNEWKHIQRLLTHLSCDIEAKRVTSKMNVADALSRGYLGDLRWYDEVLVAIPPDLTDILHQVFPPKAGGPAAK